MTVAIMQPYFMPYVGYLQLMNAVEKFVLYDDVAFINRGWINRNRMLLNGNDYMFTVPLREASQNKLINEIYIDNSVQWRSKLLKTVEQAYKKAPCFAPALELFTNVVNNDSEKITDFIADSFVILAQYLDISATIVRTSGIYNNTELKAQDRILDICKQENAMHYINPIGGVELYDKTVFEQQGMKLSFIKSQPVVYPQFKNEFVPWLSVVDILMFNDKAAIKKMLNEFELV